MSEWKPEDEVVTNYSTIVQSQHESHRQGWEDAVAMVINVCRSMYNEFDQATLEELEQRIV